MQLRVPNQYKPTFLENLFSAFISAPTRRILSDKKIEKQKKINLSLTDESKTRSTKKLTISNSFHEKTAASTNERNRLNTISTMNNNSSKNGESTLRRDQSDLLNTNKGLNFHPRRINFHTQQRQPSKGKLNLHIGDPVESVVISRQGRKTLHADSYDKTKQIKQKQKCSIEAQNLSKIRDKRTMGFLKNLQVSKDYAEKRQTFDSSSKNSSKNYQYIGNQQPKIEKPFQIIDIMKYDKMQKQQKLKSKQKQKSDKKKHNFFATNSNSNNRNSYPNNLTLQHSDNVVKINNNCRLTQKLPQRPFFQQRPIHSIQNHEQVEANQFEGTRNSSSLRKDTQSKIELVEKINKNRSHQKQINRINYFSNISQINKFPKAIITKKPIKIQKIDYLSNLSQFQSKLKQPLVTPKNVHTCPNGKLLDPQKVPIEKQDKINNKQIKDLFSAMTISSKGDFSGSKESQGFSNVIYRYSGHPNQLQKQQAKKNILNLKEKLDILQDSMKQLKQVDAEEARRKSLNTKLLQKFEQNQYNFKQAATDGKKMNFKKKENLYDNLDKHMDLGLEEQQTQINHNLKQIEQMYINREHSQFPYQRQLKSNNKFLQQTEKQTVFKQNISKNCQNKSIYEQFKKLNYLGVGRFASVYMCSFHEFNFLFAIKEVLKFTVKYNELHNQLQNQIKIQYECSSPYVISLYHAWIDDKKYYMALQYGQQTLLNKVQKNYLLKQQQCIRHVYQVAKGLQYLHSNHIIHRDIKPENIIIVNGVCKIGDFGWATRVSQFTKIREVCGTPCYISPQMEKNQYYTCKTDCWALGVLAYELINGKLDEHYFQKTCLNRDAIKYGKIVSGQFKQLIYRLLAEQQADRPSIQQLLTFPIFNNL